ncbi:hypothetical protein COV15_01520 [Candidatus Woesearchaeota archaeon CG10_big_fil_rev_8_21_14_0_10_34_12]|nr:MAG: hypothetical protein COV15_01520 [Candidatus Woesearchaeota archaeon CG10_big_fil_rev_8_21_14_0_10_34_12]
MRKQIYGCHRVPNNPSSRRAMVEALEEEDSPEARKREMAIRAFLGVKVDLPDNPDQRITPKERWERLFKK